MMLGAAGAALAMASCDSGGQAPKSQPTKMEIANPYQDKLLALSVLDRSLGLRRAIQDTRQICRRITASAYQEVYKAQHLWIGRCGPDGDYQIYVAANGNVQVRKCTDAETLMLPACRTEALETVPRIERR